jgi:CBS domain-containing membrane protein
VLIFGVPNGPLSQPRNVLVGHSVAALCGVNANMFLTMPMENALISGPLAVTIAFLLMKQANALHPPAAGTALAFAMDQGKIAAMGFEIMVPILWGTSFLVMAGTALHNIRQRGSYPIKWF